MLSIRERYFHVNDMVFNIESLTIYHAMHPRACIYYPMVGSTHLVPLCPIVLFIYAPVMVTSGILCHSILCVIKAIQKLPDLNDKILAEPPGPIV